MGHNALSRLSREALAFQKYRDALAKETVELKQRDPDRNLAANELLMLVNKMDQTFKVARPELAELLAASLNRETPRQNVPSESTPRPPPDTSHPCKSV